MNRRYLALAAIVAVVVIALSAVALVAPRTVPSSLGLAKFAGYSDLARYLDSANSNRYSGGQALGGVGPGTYSLEGSGDYSGTNVQAAGVDELDFMKTDGTYLYLVSGNNVTIVRAVPPTGMAVVAQIHASELGVDLGPNETLWVGGVFVDGSRLAVVSQSFAYYDYYCPPESVCPGAMPSFAATKTIVSVFDITQANTPALQFTHGVSGYLIAARMTGGHVYLVTNHMVVKYDDVYVLPEVCDGACEPVAVRDIFYDPGSKDAYAFTNIFAVDLAQGATGILSVVTGYTSTLYMSQSALYLTFQKWDEQAYWWYGIRTTSSHTSIYKVLADGTALEVAGEGDVPGYLWSQWAMDEHQGYLRVVTRADWSAGTDVLVLDGHLAVVGSLEGIAPGEQLFATRFVGDTLYLVTFRQVDPFFVVGLSDPAHPTLLGELTIPGFSTYLHPVDATHILGIGSENGTLKVSLYDVTDPAKPTEAAKYLVAGYYSWSQAMYEHKAFLFDREKQLLVIPVDSWDESRGSTSGAYVFRVSVDSGIDLRGVITHGGEYGYGSVQRSLYIGDSLYTVSYTMVKANALSDLAELGSLGYASYP